MPGKIPVRLLKSVLFIRVTYNGIFILKSSRLPNDICEMLNPMGIPSERQMKKYHKSFVLRKYMSYALMRCAKLSAYRKLNLH